jgi:hypothetical protein
MDRGSVLSYRWIERGDKKSSISWIRGLRERYLMDGSVQELHFESNTIVTRRVEQLPSTSVELY